MCQRIKCHKKSEQVAIHDVLKLSRSDVAGLRRFTLFISCLIAIILVLVWAKP